MSPKERIVGVICTPYEDKYVVQVTRQMDRLHMPKVRTYIADYSDFDKVTNLLRHFLNLNVELQTQIVTQRIVNYRRERNIHE